MSSYLQDLAVETDNRTRASDEVWWDDIRGDVAYLDERVTSAFEEVGLDPEQPVRVRFEVCPLCDGKGKHVNPSIDAHGLTREDFDEDPDFAESYFRGDYDQRCNLCSGEKVVPVPLDAKVIEAIDLAARWNYESWSESYAERMVGA